MGDMNRNMNRKDWGAKEAKLKSIWMCGWGHKLT